MGGVHDPISTTRASYDQIAAAFLAKTRDRRLMAPRLARFAAELSAGALVLDLGAGPGCDSAALRQSGLRAVAIDLSLGMLRAGVAEFPGARVQADLRRLPIRAHTADGVWANASLLHLPPADFSAALAEISRVTRARGPVMLAVKRGEGGSWESERYGSPRWFQYWRALDLDLALEQAGFRLLGSWEEERPRDDWLVRLCANGGAAE